MAYDKLGEKGSAPLVFQPDSLVSEHLIDMMIQGTCGVGSASDCHHRFEHQTPTDHAHRLERWGMGDLTYKLYSALTDDDQNTAVMETYFWLFWRGWAGLLDPSIVAELPNAEDDIVSLIAEGSPLRGVQLRRLKTTIIWAFANAVGTWGEVDAFHTGDLEPGHLQLRQMMEDYIDKRMVMLHGERYQISQTGQTG